MPNSCATPDTKVVLVTLDGIARKWGVDVDGAQWAEFDVDAFAEQEPGECCICDAALQSGWLCLDGGDEVCAAHIQEPHAIS